MRGHSLVTLLAVFVGGMVGTLARVGLDVVLPHATPGSLAWSTALVNVIGSFALGLLTGAVWFSPSGAPWLKVGVGVGLLGSFTTLSAVALNVVAAMNEGRWVDALLALAFSLVPSLGAAWLGVRVGSRRAGRAATQEAPHS